MLALFIISFAQYKIISFAYFANALKLNVDNAITRVGNC